MKPVLLCVAITPTTLNEVPSTVIVSPRAEPPGNSVVARVEPITATFAEAARSASVNELPDATSAVVTSKYSGVVPIIDTDSSAVVADDTVRDVLTWGTTAATWPSPALSSASPTAVVRLSAPYRNPGPRGANLRRCAHAATLRMSGHAQRHRIRTSSR